MAKVKLKKSLQVVLENSKQALIKVINESMLRQAQAKDEISWLLLEFTLEYPFPPTLGLAQKKEAERLRGEDEHPLIAYNCADLELFSENQNIVMDFDPYEELFETADQLLEEVEYEDRQPFMFQLYVDVCKALMLESVNWKHLNLAADFHVTARDYEICDEAEYLKKLLPKKAYTKIKRKLEAYDAKINDAYANDETVVKVKALMEQESVRYEELLAGLTPEMYTDVYSPKEVYFLRPFYAEMKMHKRPEEIEQELSTQKPVGQLMYYQYKFQNNLPQLLDYYYEDKLIWRKIFQHKENQISYHKFFLKTGTSEIEDYAVITTYSSEIIYEKYMDGHYEKTVYHKNEFGQITHAVHERSRFVVGYKMDATFEYFFEYKNDELFKVCCVNQNKQRSVSYCKDDSFIEEAIDDFIGHICTFAIGKMKTESLTGLDAVILEYDHTLAFYFNIQLFRNKNRTSISTYEQYEDDSAMMNLTVYTTESVTSSDQEYLSRKKAAAYITETYTRLCSTLSQRIFDTFQLSVPVVTKYIYDELDM